MGSRISPEHNPVPLLLKPQPIADKILPIPIPTTIDVPLVGPKNLPVNLLTGSKPAVKVRPKGESRDVVAPAVVETSKAVLMAIEYRAGGGKMKSVIPKKRKLVKTMIYHTMKDFVKSLFRPPPSAGTPP